jgi:hypothetical protein
MEGMMKEKNIPGKRLRNWHRVHRAAGRTVGSLREYARALVATAAASNALPSDRERALTAFSWLTGKNAKVTAPGHAS